MNQREEREMVASAIEEFDGNVHTLEGAIGAYFVGKVFGWKPLALVHEKRTLRRYEEILGVSFREVLPEVGPGAGKLVAWEAVQKVSNFWKAVKGDIPGVRSSEVRQTR